MKTKKKNQRKKKKKKIWLLVLIIRRDRRWDSDCAHAARRDLEWLDAVPSFKTQCAIRARQATTLLVIQGGMHVGHAQNAVGISSLLFLFLDNISPRETFSLPIQIDVKAPGSLFRDFFPPTFLKYLLFLFLGSLLLRPNTYFRSL